ncbi:Os04g0519912 [Oryza sativa Japonica Group]|uniref:Os04g0519912 protein n=1 Tax=Oryza sativa subsp. japonica TaxID=39947 RepID=A0A0P0WCH7_ORYSJ|nr:hypothetical protein EE612_024462 [Oryza sativa]BAS90115.1 Os04g0519912 [Oryza sativa Japonica Group]
MVNVTKSIALFLPQENSSSLRSTNSFVNFPGVLENRVTYDDGSVLPLFTVVVSTTCTTFTDRAISSVNAGRMPLDTSASARPKNIHNRKPRHVMVYLIYERKKEDTQR